MNFARTLKYGLFLTAALAAVGAHAQVPDLLNALDSGGRAMGIGGASRVTDANTYSALDNPAGLAYVRGLSYETSLRNLPESGVVATGNFADRTTTTSGQVGKIGLTHVGATFPVKGGTFGFSYTLGGYINNRTTGNNLTSNTLTVRNLTEETRAQTDYFAFSFGKSYRNMNVGYGLVVANQYSKFAQHYDLFNGNTNVGTTDSDVSGNGIGVGLLFGLQGTANSETPMMWGASIRTPIDLTGNGDSSAAFDRVPGKLSGGLAGRVDSVGSDQEFLTWAFQGDYYFGGQSDKLIPRDDVFAFGAGLEYNFNRYNARIPLRFGYQFIPAGGNGFSDRNALTFGLGYRPHNADFSVDLNFAKSNATSKFDIGLGITYKPKN